LWKWGGPGGGSADARSMMLQPGLQGLDHPPDATARRPAGCRPSPSHDGVAPDVVHGLDDEHRSEGRDRAVDERPHDRGTKSVLHPPIVGLPRPEKEGPGIALIGPPPGSPRRRGPAWWK
jgi:hypothetical protein